jgi:hypothetical protein
VTDEQVLVNLIALGVVAVLFGLPVIIRGVFLTRRDRAT